MNWDLFIDFIKAQDPAFIAARQGVPLDDIKQCEAGCKIALPKSYVNFLQLMGQAGGKFRPFGATMEHNFYDLVEQLPAEDYPGDQFFKIAAETDSSLVAYYDLFLDLRRSDGEDAPLVTFEDGVELRPGAVNEVGLTFDESMMESVFTFFALHRRAKRAVVTVDSTQLRDKTVGLLMHMGFQQVWSPLPRIACLRRDTFCALVKVGEDTRTLDVELGADDNKSLGIAVEQLLSSLPGARTRKAY